MISIARQKIPLDQLVKDARTGDIVLGQGELNRVSLYGFFKEVDGPTQPLW